MATRTRTRIDFSELGWLAARIGRATVNWRLTMGLGPIPEGFDPEPLELCPRCEQEKSNVGPWHEAPYTRLCGQCKAEIVLESAENRDALVRDIRRALRHGGRS